MFLYKPKWEFAEYDETKVNLLINELNISRTLAILLYTRGYDTPEKARKFISPDIIFDLRNPFIFKDMEKTVIRIRDAITKKEKILIYGDRDVDGVTATAILYKALKHLKAKVEYKLPSKDTGYGLSERLIKKFADSGIKLLITVDNGITAFKEVDIANKYNIDVIITDHHNPSKDLPAAFSIINPKVPDEKYEFKELAGVGVVYKLISALFLSFHKYYMKEIVVFDIETTGFTDDDEIIEICAIKLKNNIEIDIFHRYIKPQKPIPLFIQEMTGIDNAKISDAAQASIVIPEFYKFIEDAILVGHNLKDFDFKFIKKEIKKYCNTELKNPIIDTLEISRQKFPGKSHKLKDLAEYMKIPDLKKDKFHTARYDAQITKLIFEKLLTAGFKKMRKVLETYSEFAAIGTLGDIVPLIDENRIIVKKGIERLKNTNIIGFQVLLNQLDIDIRKINSKVLSWKVIPVLNAAGRMGMADYAIKLLLTENIKEAKEIAAKLIKLNQERKHRLDENFEKVIQILPEKVDIERDKIFIVDIENIEHGVTGIVANRLKDIYYRPIVILIIKDSTAIGSARSIKGFVIKNAFDKCKDYVEEMGGHPYAVGFSIKKENIPLLKEKLKEIAEKEIKPEDLIPVITIDTELEPEELNTRIIEEIVETFEPYGEENEEPVFLLKEFQIKEIREVGDNNEHLFMRVTKNQGYLFNAIWWGKSEEMRDILKEDSFVDIVCRLELDEWNEKKYIKFLVEDIKVLSNSEHKILHTGG